MIKIPNGSSKDNAMTQLTDKTTSFINEVKSTFLYICNCKKVKRLSYGNNSKEKNNSSFGKG